MIARGLCLLVAVLSAGCASTPLDAPLSGPTIVFKRNLGFFGTPEVGRCLTAVHVNRHRAGSLDLGQVLTFDVGPGLNRIEGSSGGGNCPNFGASYYVRGPANVKVSVRRE